MRACRNRGADRVLHTVLAVCVTVTLATSLGVATAQGSGPKSERSEWKAGDALNRDDWNQRVDKTLRAALPGKTIGKQAESLAKDEPFRAGREFVAGRRETHVDGSMTRNVWIVRDTKARYSMVRIEEDADDATRTTKAGVSQAKQPVEMVADHVIVRFKASDANTMVANLARLERGGFKLRHKLTGTDTMLISFDGSTPEALDKALAGLGDDAAVSVVEPDRIMKVCAMPNDPRFGEMWGLHNRGQTGGTPGVDIKAPEAWDITTGNSNVVVAVLDTGVDYTHPDLAANMWLNPGETGLDSSGKDKRTNGIDDDGNGYVDDYRGYDFGDDDADPIDEMGHGTHCAGTIGAVGNNGLGVVGVNHRVKIMPIKMNPGGVNGFYASSIVASWDYVLRMKRDHGINIRVTSNSYGGPGDDVLIRDAIAATVNAGILNIVAAGNSAGNNDVSPQYPASYDVENIVAVAATDHNDALASFSCYGLTSVDLGAPGVKILSTLPTNETATTKSWGQGPSYGTISGTSMATPHVAGVAALVCGLAPDILTFRDIRAAILNGADPIPALAGKCVTGARLNALKALQYNELVAREPVVSDVTGSGVSGNGDSVINPGETVGLRIAVFTAAQNGLTSLTGTLALVSGAAGLTVTAGQVNYGNIPSGGSSGVTSNFIIRVDPSVTTPHPFQFAVTFRDASGKQWVKTFNLSVYTSTTVSGKVTLDGAGAAGVTVRLKGARGDATETDALGMYRVTAVDGEATIRAEKDGWVSSLERRFAFPTSAFTLNFTFQTATVSGRVLDRNTWAGLEGADVTYAAGEIKGKVRTGAQGDFSISKVFGRGVPMELLASKSGYNIESPYTVSLVPPSASDIVLSLGTSTLVTAPNPVEVTAVEGTVVNVPLRLSNTGCDPVDWRLYHELHPDISIQSGGRPPTEWGTPGYTIRFIYPLRPDLSRPYGVAYDEQRKALYLNAWSTQHAGRNAIFVLDPVSGEVTNEFEVTGLGFALAMKWDGEYLWASDIEQEKFVAIDVATHAVVRSLPWPTKDLGTWGYNSLAVSKDTIWTASRAYESDPVEVKQNMYRLDKQTGQVVAKMSLAGMPRGVTDIHYYQDTLWIAMGEYAAYFRLNPWTGENYGLTPYSESWGSIAGLCDDGAGNMWIVQDSFNLLRLVATEAKEWLSESPLHGKLTRNETTGVTLRFDATKIGVGHHTAQLRFVAGDPKTYIVTETNEVSGLTTTTVPVSFTVVPAGGNAPPTAEAGPDVTVTAGVNGFGTVTLDGRGSSDAGGGIVAWWWTDGSGSPIASGAVATVSMTVGLHPVTLHVRDTGGALATDSLLVNVLSRGVTPPIADAGPDQSIAAAAGTNLAMVVLDGRQSRDADGFIARHVWTDETNAVFAIGATPIVPIGFGVHRLTLTVTDNDYLSGSDTVIVTVVANPQMPDVDVQPGSLSAVLQQGQCATVTVSVANHGGTALGWSAFVNNMDGLRMRYMFDYSAAIPESRYSYVYDLVDDGSGLWFSSGFADCRRMWKTDYSGNFLRQFDFEARFDPTDPTHVAGNIMYMDYDGARGLLWYYDQTAWVGGRWIYGLNPVDGAIKSQIWSTAGMLPLFGITVLGDRLYGSDILGAGFRVFDIPSKTEVAEAFFKTPNGQRVSSMDLVAMRDRLVLARGPQLMVVNPTTKIAERTVRLPSGASPRLAWDGKDGIWVLDSTELDVAGARAVYKVDGMADILDPWCAVGLATGSVSPGGQQQLAVVLRAPTNRVGLLTCEVQIDSNDPDRPLVTVPVALKTVAANGNTAPTASFTATPLTGSAPLNVTFDASASSDANGDPLTYEWNMGDGAMLTGRTVSHQFGYGGTFRVELRVKDGRGGVGEAQTAVTALSASVTTLPYFENFDDGKADYLAPVAGTWSVASGRYTCDAPSGWGLSLVQLAAHPWAFEMETILRAKNGAASAGNGRLIFYYKSSTDFYYAGADDRGDAWVVGRMTASGPVDNYYAREAIPSDRAYRLTVKAHWPSVSLFVDGKAKIGGSLDEAPSTTMRMGVGVLNGAVEFDDLRIASEATVAPAPKAIDDTFRATRDRTLSMAATGVMGNDILFGASVTPTLTAGASHGRVTLRIDGSFDYVPDAGFEGVDSFRYRLSSGTTNSNEATVSLAVLAGGTPVVSLTAPVAGTSYTAPATVGLAAQASDSDGAIVRVEFRSNGVKLPGGDDTTAPYAMQWTSVPAGSYALTARATDDDGQTVESASVTISVGLPGNHAPGAIAFATPVSGAAPLTVQFTAVKSQDPDGDVPHFAWDFGDGGTATGTTATRQYTVAGTYRATLIVTDGKGGESRATAVIVVK